MRGANFPDFGQLQNWSVNRAGEYEVVRQSLYDFQTYAAAGQTSLSFFQTPKGQAGKTIDDTNVELAGMLPAPKHFVVQSIEVYFVPADSPVLTGAALATPNHLNDVFAVWESGALDFFIGSKSYLQEAPLGRFPQKTHIYTETAAATTVAASQITADYGAFAGRPYFIDPWVLIAPTQNFNVTLSWATAVALPSTNAGRIGVVLDGLLYRLSQ